ncbi:MAG: glucosaminidase domain-containing protein [Tannerellaceae bacterium]|nr:glucosaminidase domain-containing protein [Tannerellaceae bacterium]
MKRETFINTYFPLARVAGERFKLNPVVMLAQAALESGWGQSTLACEHHNFFGLTAYGKANDFWPGEGVQLREGSLCFRRYDSPQQSFLDYARLICSSYKSAAAMSFYPEAFAKEIAYSRYISEENGDDREMYRRSLVAICKTIERFQ